LRSWILAASVTLLAAPVAAQAPSPRGGGLDMQAIAAALGVACEYCHGQGGAPMLTAAGRPRLEVARAMIRMTTDLNARVEAASGKAAADAVRVDCVTCHRGVAVPRQLQDLIWEATLQRGAEAAVALYRDLRARYYGRQSYDFGEETLLGVADRLIQGRPAAAIALADLNLEFHPASARSYLTKGIAQSQQLDDEGAIVSFRKSLELDPENGVTQGWLIQSEQFVKRRR
jgi:tetratricopeptide (TPR) repeat protein